MHTAQSVPQSVGLNLNEVSWSHLEFYNHPQFIFTFFLFLFFIPGPRNHALSTTQIIVFGELQPLKVATG